MMQVEKHWACLQLRGHAAAEEHWQLVKSVKSVTAGDGHPTCDSVEGKVRPE
jgi:hypothetical protein